MRQLVELGYRGSGEALKRSEAPPSLHSRTHTRASRSHGGPLTSAPLPIASSLLYVSSDEFEARKREIEQLKYKAAHKVPKILCSAGREYGSAYPFLQALADREEMVRNGKLTSILFIRDKNSKGQEVSGYIDFAHRLKIEDFTPYFARKKKLIPRPADLSYYNWETQTSVERTDD
jgi:hypothetical protein